MSDTKVVSSRFDVTDAHTLAGYRRDASEMLVPWPVEPDCSLWSDVLGLRLVVEAGLLLAETADGERLRSPEQEAAARLEAKAENERLRQELSRLKRERT